MARQLFASAAGLPWTNYEFRRQWRKVADAAGVPKSICNKDRRERRTGADAIASDDDIPIDGRAGSANERARELIETIKSLLRGQSLYGQDRDDVVHDIALDVHAGKIKISDLSPKLCHQYVTRHYRRSQEGYKTLSLDQPVPGKDNGKLGDLISSREERLERDSVSFREAWRVNGSARQRDEANSTTYHATAAGGGANNVGVTCDGTTGMLTRTWTH